ncbi:MAG: type II toxin-antitoxin system VapC family toxin [Pseudomonadota bacterium]|nr:type II toxin-antitoxin system VapC family toxin [Pseudomonadota bacterium]
MSFHVIDASFAIKWFLPEEGSDKALSILEDMERFFIPDLFLIETDSIVTKKVRRRELDLSEAPVLQHQIRQLPYIIVPYQDISKFALELSTTMYISHYDACYLAVAIEAEGVLYTADIRMYNGLKKTPFNKYVVSITKL